jgi:phage-related protein
LRFVGDSLARLREFPHTVPLAIISSTGCSAARTAKRDIELAAKRFRDLLKD